MNRLNEFFNFIKNYELRITEEQVLDWLKITRRWPVTTQFNSYLNHIVNGPLTETVSVIANDGRKYTNFYSTHDATGLYLDFDKWFYFHERGYTSTINDILDLSEDLREICKVSRDIIGYDVQGNFYFSRKSNKNMSSFIPHSHEYNVIAKQIYGKSLWTLNGKNFHLDEQEAVLIPKGFDHAVLSKETDKLSLTINLTH